MNDSFLPIQAKPPDSLLLSGPEEPDLLLLTSYPMRVAGMEIAGKKTPDGPSRRSGIDNANMLYTA
jgi:hypothetical protein